MNARMVTRAAAAAAALVLLAACAPAVTYPSREPDAVGTASDVTVAGADGIRFVLGGYADGAYFYNAAITVGPQTTVGDAEGRPIDPQAIASDARVSVWVDACAESYPVQCAATALRVDG